MSELILGIDLGTTNSAVGVVDSGFPILLANEEGKRIVPSAVWFGANGEVEVGEKALRRRETEPGRVVTSVKRWMGERNCGLRISDCGFPDPLPIRDPQSAIRNPERVSAEILKELKRIAEWRMGAGIRKAVITVPAYFNDGQRGATLRAGELAGLEVVRILNEPTAAALAYGLDRLGERSRVAVYDLGGGTFDVSILEMQEGVFQVLATHGDTQLGGDDLDGLLKNFGMRNADFGREEALLMVEAEGVKRALSEGETAVFGGREISRRELEEVARPWIARTLRYCGQALADANLKVGELDAVVLVGGSTRMPAVRRAVGEFFGREPDVSQHPDETVALGATVEAGILAGSLRQVILLDVTPLSLGVETYGGLMNVLIPRNTTIPCKAGEMFTNAAAGQRTMGLRVLQGEREMARDNWELGKFEVGFAAAETGAARVGVEFRIDANGILEVLARDVATGVDTVVRVGSAAVDVTDVAVEAMVNESVEYAFTDMAERIFTEARMKAEELLPAVEMVLRQGLATETERVEIEAAAAGVRAALAGGSGNFLKAAVQKLDRATEVLAARLVDRAMEAAVERRLGL